MRWNVRLTPSVVALVVAGLVVGAGCRSEGSGSQGATPSTSSVPASTPATTARLTGGPLTGVAAAAAADEVCTRIDGEIAAVAQPAGPTAVEPYLRQLVAIYRGEIAELQAIADRSGDPAWQRLVTVLRGYFDLVEADLPQLAQDPAAMNAPGTPTGDALATAAREAAALGLRVCGRGSSSTPGSGSG